MKTCTKCSCLNIPDSENYCPKCGSRSLEAMPPPVPGVAAPEIGGARAATLGQRMGAFLIDQVIAFAIAMLTNIGGLNIIVTPVLFFYQLFRDFNGASVGKRILGLRVVSKDGARATGMQLMLRNCIFALPALATIIPLAGFIVASGIDSALYVMELLLLIFTRNRLGDRMASTMVIVGK